MDQEFKVILPEKTIKRLRKALITGRLASRGSSLPEDFVLKMLDLIKEGKKEYTFIINEDKAKDK